MIRVEGDRIAFAPEVDTGCAGCEAGGDNTAGPAGCPACGLFASRKVKTMEAVNRQGLPLAPGDRVVVALAPRKTIIAVFFVFVLPLAAFALGFIVTAALLPAAPEEWKALGGTAGFALAYLVVFLRRRLRKTKDWPEVIEKCAPDRERAPAPE